MSDLKYSEDHEWIQVEGDIGTIGISNYAQEQLGDIVFVELPEIGRAVKRGEEVAVIESVKAAADCKAPVGGTVIEVNKLLADDPGKVNQDPTGAGWFFKLRIEDARELDSLMDEAAYEASTK